MLELLFLLIYLFTSSLNSFSYCLFLDPYFFGVLKSPMIALTLSEKLSLKFVFKPRSLVFLVYILVIDLFLSFKLLELPEDNANYTLYKKRIHIIVDEIIKHIP